MQRSYGYNGFTIEVSVERGVTIGTNRPGLTRDGYVAIVRIFKKGNAIGIFSPLRFGDMGGRPFATEIDALMGGYGAACKIVDDLFPTTGTRSFSGPQ